MEVNLSGGVREATVANVRFLQAQVCTRRLVTYFVIVMFSEESCVSCLVLCPQF